MSPSPRTYVNAYWAFQRYQQVRARLPRAGRSGKAEQRGDLGELAEHYDVFVFDSFGVLNVGGAPIAGAAGRVASLRAQGKEVLVLTNAARDPLASLPAKYARLGFDFTAREIISSRGVLASHLKARSIEGAWWVVAPVSSEIGELGVPACHAAPPEGAGGIILLSASTLTDALIGELAIALTARPVPLLVGNPDLVAPREEGFSLEPGACAHQLADEIGVVPEFFGKPFANAFDAVMERLAGRFVRERIAMVGDTLHTDILGGSAAGFGTVLVSDHGVLQGVDIPAAMAESGIYPDFIVPHI
ncbi:MAG: HAD hydrolase-like protein [Pseudomonadota bacterium]